MNTACRKTVIVLGAGPAGLSIGYELSRRGIDYLILEKGQVAGESFAHYPRNIFFGPWRNNTLPGSKVAWNWALRRATQPAYTWYLGEYARRNELPIQFGCEVTQVLRDGPGFELHTTLGTYRCQLLVNCSGYFSTPNFPHYPGQERASLKFMHSQNYRDADDLARLLGGHGGRVLVVGGGLTAGETVMDLYRRGYAVSLSHRSRLVFGPSPWVEALTSPWHWLVERVAIASDIRLNSNPPMAGGEIERLIKRGRIPTYPGIASFADDTVHFVDGQSAAFDAVIYATGYFYTTRHLRSLLPEGEIELKDMESEKVKGLFFLGLDQQRTYRSRFLRGIRADARKLGKLIEERLARQPVWTEPRRVLFDPDECPQPVRVGV